MKLKKQTDSNFTIWNTAKGATISFVSVPVDRLVHHGVY